MPIPFRAIVGREGEQGHTPRAQLDSTLADPRELSGVLNKALTALKRLQERGALRESETMRAAWDEFRQATDPLAVWLDRDAVEHPRARVLRRKLLQAYNADCERHGRPPLTEQSFGRAIRRLRPAIKEAQRTIDGKSKQWVWLGIGLKSDQEGAAGWSQRTGEGG